MSTPNEFNPENLSPEEYARWQKEATEAQEDARDVAPDDGDDWVF